jgi:hypothetical protein
MNLRNMEIWILGWLSLEADVRCRGSLPQAGRSGGCSAPAMVWMEGSLGGDGERRIGGSGSPGLDLSVAPGGAEKRRLGAVGACCAQGTGASRPRAWLETLTKVVAVPVPARPGAARRDDCDGLPASGFEFASTGLRDRRHSLERLCATRAPGGVGSDADASRPGALGEAYAEI